MIFWTLFACQPAEKESFDTAQMEEEQPIEEETETELDYIAINAAVNEITTSSEGGETLQLTAVAHWNTGESSIIHPLWTMTNSTVGDIDAFGLFTPSTETGGSTTLVATYGGAAATFNLTVKYEQVENDENVDTSAFEQESVLIGDIGIIYPEDGTMIPKNTPSLAFQWPNFGAISYELKFQSNVTEVTIYTTDTVWTSSNQLWPVIGNANAGDSVSVTLSVDHGGGLIETYDPMTLEIGLMEGDGSIIYWSPTIQGLMEIPYGGGAQTYLANGTCVGCHTASSQGVLAFSYDGGDGPLGLRDIDSQSDILVNGPITNFKTFSPDGTYLLANIYGTLKLFDGLSGTHLMDYSFSTANTSLTHMDWSPDGTSVVAVWPYNPSGDLSFTGGRLVLLEHLGNGMLGEPQILLDLGPNENAYYPAFSPDSNWIAFNRSTEDAYDDTTAEVWVISATGGSPIRLDAANKDVNLTNSWPKWAKSSSYATKYWLTFSSRRDYINLTSAVPQIWISAFDSGLAANGLDPSYPAFWLPNQDHATNNHQPVWVQ